MARVAGAEDLTQPESGDHGVKTGKTKVTILTGTYRIKGSIDLLPGARVTDYMARPKDSSRSRCGSVGSHRAPGFHCAVRQR